MLPKQHTIRENIVPGFLLVWQMPQNSKAKGRPLVLCGAAMTGAEITKTMVSSIGGASQFYSSHFEMICFTYMGEWEKAEVPLDTMHSIFAAHPHMLNAAHYNVPLLYTFADVIWHKCNEKKQATRRVA
jgi:hypothetical protein